MTLLMHDSGTFSGLHIWVELEDDSLQADDQTRLLIFVKNENREVSASNVEVELEVQPKGPTIVPNPIEIEDIVPGRTIKGTLILNAGDSKKGNYTLRMDVDFHLVPATWILDPLPFQIQ
jgi:hypothetical protein